jgi:hypothetical protein
MTCGKRTLIKGKQIKDETITSDDLAKDSVITEKIKDENVTCAKLESGLCERLLASDTPIGRVKIVGTVPAHTDFTIPSGLSYNISLFVERVAVYKNGQLLFNGDSPPTNNKDPVEVWPGSSNNKIVFDFPLRNGETIQVIVL